MPRSFTKDPDAVLDYQWDWAGAKPWLTDGDTIVDYTITVPAGLTLDSSEATDTTVTAWLSGGIDRETYSVTCHIVTAAGREDDRTITFTMQER